MGGEAQLTVMVLKVDLGCTKCCRKIKKVLCSTPQVRDQLFDDKSNTVTCTVICYTPEKIADKISRKAGRTIKGIEIKPSQPQLPAKPPAEKPREGPPPPQADKPKQGPPPPKAAPPDDKPKSAPPPSDKPKSDDKPKSAPPPADKPKSDDKPKVAAGPPPAEKPKGEGDADKPKPQPQKAAPNGGEPKKTPQLQQMPMGPAPQQQMPMGPPPQMAMKPNQPAAFMSPEFIPVAGYPSIFPPVVYYDGGPYYQNQGRAVFPHQQPVYQYDGYQGRPVGDYYGGGGRGDDNPTTCSVM